MFFLRFSQSEYLFHGIALWGELFLFLFHLHHRNPLDVYLHLLLTGMIILGILVSVVELLNPHEPIYGLIRSWTYLMQGTWFWQVSSINIFWRYFIFLRYYAFLRLSC